MTSDDAGIDITYRMCYISVANYPPFKAATLFDTGAHASFIDREDAAWIGKYPGPAKQLGARKRGRREEQEATVLLGSVVFDLTFLNEVIIKDIHAQVIDSSIAVIIGRPIIRVNHLVQKIPLTSTRSPEPAS